MGDALGAAMAGNDSIVALNVAAVGLVDARSLFKGLRPKSPLRALNVANNACAAAPSPPPLPSRTKWTRLVHPSRTKWTRLVL